jgi:hypothetical protein
MQESRESVQAAGIFWELNYCLACSDSVNSTRGVVNCQEFLAKQAKFADYSGYTGRTDCAQGLDWG